MLTCTYTVHQLRCERKQVFNYSSEISQRIERKVFVNFFQNICNLIFIILSLNQQIHVVQNLPKIGPFGHLYHHSSPYSNPHCYSSFLSSGSRSNHHHNDTTNIINIVNKMKTTNRMMPQLQILPHFAFEKCQAYKSLGPSVKLILLNPIRGKGEGAEWVERGTDRTGPSFSI